MATRGTHRRCSHDPWAHAPSLAQAWVECNDAREVWKDAGDAAGSDMIVLLGQIAVMRLNLPTILVEDLVELGHDIDTAMSEGLAGHEDPEVWSGAQAAGRMLLTQDLDFSDVRVFAPDTHPGLVLVRMREPGLSAPRTRGTEPVASVLIVIGRKASESPVHTDRGWTRGRQWCALRFTWRP